MTDARASLYDAGFYGRLDASVRASAEVVVPLVLAPLEVSSVVDVGCGAGTWLSVFREAGVDDVLGVDGDHVDTTALAIPASAFVARDLEAPLHLGRRFDLVVSLEVAEHLDPAWADSFVDELVGLGTTILFSGAIPFQGGRHHVHEAWPSAWVARFAARGLVPIDLVRPAVWDDGRVLPWYAQNVLLFTTADQATARGLAVATGPIDLVHPRLWEGAHAAPPSVRASAEVVVREVRRLPRLALDAVRRRRR